MHVRLVLHKDILMQIWSIYHWILVRLKLGHHRFHYELRLSIISLFLLIKFQNVQRMEQFLSVVCTEKDDLNFKRLVQNSVPKMWFPVSFSHFLFLLS